MADGVESFGRARDLTHLDFPRDLQIVTVDGAVDAANHRDLGRYVVRHLHPTTQLLLDLRAVDFFGAQGFSALYYISGGAPGRSSTGPWSADAMSNVCCASSIRGTSCPWPTTSTSRAHLEHLVCRRYPIPGADIRQTGFN